MLPIQDCGSGKSGTIGWSRTSFQTARLMSLADGVEAPVDIHAGERLSARFRTAAAWVGWAAAAALALGVYTGRIEPGRADGARQAGLFPIGSPEDALQLSMDKGQEAGSVIGEVPERLLLSTEPAPDGGFSVVYLRQIIERQRVEDIYRFGRNEAGDAVPVPVKTKARGTRY